MIRRARFYRIILFIALLFWLSSYAQQNDTLHTSPQQNIRLNAFVENSRVPANGIVVLHIEVSWPGKLNQYQIEPVTQPILTNLLLEGSGSENRLISGDAGEMRSLKAITYRLRPLEMGMAYIDGIVIKYLDRINNSEDNLSSQRIMIEVTEPLPENRNNGFKPIVYIVLLVIFFCIMVYFIIAYFRKKNQNGQEESSTISIAEQFLQQLSQKVDPRGTNLDEMTVRLSRIFRDYIDQDFNIPAKELSTNEVISGLKQLDLDKKDVDKLSEVFQKLDEIKFTGKLIDPSEFTNVYGTIEDFLLRRKQQFDSSRYSAKEEK